MSPQFEELGYQKTPLGELSLRRRRHPTLNREVYEVKLGEEYLMSSLYTDSERALGEKGVQGVLGGRGGESLKAVCEETSRRAARDRGSDLSGGAAITGATGDAGGFPSAAGGTASTPGANSSAGPRGATSPSAADPGGLSVVVGGLGLGYTAEAVLEFAEVGSLIVVELFEAVIDWHREGILPVGRKVSGDSRCRLVQEDFFARALSGEGFDPESPGRKFDAVLVDIDHTPDTLLDPHNATLYTAGGLSRVSEHLRPGGVFGVWSDDPPDEPFRQRLEEAFGAAVACPVTFDVFDQKRTYTQSVYLARRVSEQAG